MHAYVAVHTVCYIRHAIIGMLENPPADFKDVVKAHFYLRKDAIKEQVCVTLYAMCCTILYCTVHCFHRVTGQPLHVVMRVL
jgi:hypothetical protein